MDKTIEKVKEFCELFDHKVDKSVATEPVTKLRMGIIIEELFELFEAQSTDTKIFVLQYLEPKIKELRDAMSNEVVNAYRTTYSKRDTMDALVDLRYVLDGTTLAYGLADDFDRVFDAVHENNMSKATKDEAVANMSVEYYRESQDVECRYEIKEVNGVYYYPIKVVVAGKYPVGKVLKPLDFTAVEFYL